ncbi:deleted in malignant brain tumors 1 protein [Betta splendens]|uniref:Deleted in malignant brain tumors 1 protein n=1 Tax=Betta splendens TaxID=158456 RepID=A0A6P7PYA0_BETSP|nr:deleted in malignant brain tumors 1 protein [Betta splendens]
MWTLLVLCSVIAAHGARGDDRNGTTEKISASCGGYLYGRSGTFYSPNYPNYYPSNSACTWYLSPGSAVVQLDLSNVNIQAQSSCDFDALYIYDGSSNSSRLLGKVCGNKDKVTFHSTGAFLTVHFKSDRSSNFFGFRADYKVVGSCRYNCNYQVGNCSCSSSCQYRGDCCHDYTDHCVSTTAPVTARPSCRYNCGYHMGSCSCSSTCQYYGNCCYDYNYHCSSTTRLPSKTTARPSCRYNCGYDLGSCSCSSSCQRYGNCCYDYYSHCDWTTKRPAVTTARPSCRHNCGYHMGSCSCSSSCQHYGNCCYDYYSQCGWTTDRPAVTTAQPSCRHNCGYHMGSCSCSSSCQRYGNCCHDYYYYCPTTTVRPTAQPSCRYYCGSHLGSCSCSSSCEYYGNCCYDYYSQCSDSTPAPTTVSPCGGSLFGSGTFTSPKYPSYYPENAHCVWQLRVSYNHRIYLAFTSLQLENCCSCDYIQVYDGPNVGSPYLGKLCNTTLNSFYSSSNYLTVLFRSDASVVAQGFVAKFTSTLPPKSGRVTCSSNIMNIVIQTSYLDSLGYNGYSVSVDDPNCRAQVSSSQVVFSFPINTCGTVRKIENGRTVYTNVIRAYPDSLGQIIRQSPFRMNVECRMEQDSVSQIMYLGEHQDNATLEGTGRFNTSMDFYTSSSFYNKVTQFPYVVTLNQNLYIQVDLRRADSSLFVFIDTCVASPSPYDFQNRIYYLVENGCRRDTTYNTLLNGRPGFARFTFKAFQFQRAAESVYIQCKVRICPAYDNSACRPGCYRRKARDLGPKHDSQTLVIGPIQLKDPEKKEEGTQEDKA